MWKNCRTCSTYPLSLYPLLIPYLIGYICHLVFSDLIFISIEGQSTSQHPVV